jgi:hypothetical protein
VFPVADLNLKNRLLHDKSLAHPGFVGSPATFNTDAAGNFDPNRNAPEALIYLERSSFLGRLLGRGSGAANAIEYLGIPAYEWL